MGEIDSHSKKLTTTCSGPRDLAHKYYKSYTLRILREIYPTANDEFILLYQNTLDIISVYNSGNITRTFENTKLMLGRTRDIIMYPGK